MNKRELIKSYSDKNLIHSLKRLAKVESDTVSEILLHLVEVDSRKLYLEAGYNSLFSFCTLGPLKYSEPAAYRRISSARAIAKYPELLKLLLDKEISLSTLALASSHLKDETKDVIISNIKGKSKRETKEFLAIYKPSATTKDSIKPVVLNKRREKDCVPLFENNNKSNTSTETNDKSKVELEPQVEKEQRYEMRFSIPKEVMQKLNTVQALLSNKYPRGAKLEQVLDEVLETYLDKHSPKRREQRREKRKQKQQLKQEGLSEAKVKDSTTKFIGIAKRDKVLLASNNQCSYLSPDGIRCTATECLEIHHIDPWAKSKNNDISNLTVMCREHNLMLAEKDYGAEVMKPYLK